MHLRELHLPRWLSVQYKHAYLHATLAVGWFFLLSPAHSAGDAIPKLAVSSFLREGSAKLSTRQVKLMGEGSSLQRLLAVNSGNLRAQRPIAGLRAAFKKHRIDSF